MEGPQTRVLAEHLDGILAGQAVERIDVPLGRWQANVMLLNCAGQVIQRVRAHGSWLFFDFSHGVTWMCHLLARATWRTRSAPRKAAPNSPRFAGGHPTAAPAPLLALTVRNGTVATLIGRPLFLICPTEGVGAHPEIRAGGPDPLQEPFAAEDFLLRLRQAAQRTLASALLDRRIVSGVGNALKCEILFAAKLPPDTRIAGLYASQLDAIAAATVNVARRAYQHLAQIAPQTQVYQVYDRAGEPCSICGSEIAVDRSGADGHWTWYCPTCQKASSERTLFE